MLVILIYLMSRVCDSAPLQQNMVDMTHTFGETTLHHPSKAKFQLDVVANGTLPDGMWLQAEEYQSHTHIGTHIDAPAHVALGGQTVDQIPLSCLIGPAAVVDITDKAERDPDAEVTVEDLLHWESVTGQNLNKTILLVRTGWGKKYNNKTAYYGSSDPDLSLNTLHTPGFPEGTARWLVTNRDILGFGVDTFSLDKGNSPNFIVHQILMGHGIYGVEHIANMEMIPIYGATLYVIPMKIGKAGGAPTRVFATYPKVIFDHHLQENNK